jgi:hypothetical protein
MSHLSSLATPEQATNGAADTSAMTKAQEELQGVPAAIEKVIECSTAARVKNKFKWQWAGGSNNSSKFKEEALTPGQGIKVYGFVQEDSPVIQTIHGLERFFDSEAPAEFSGKPMAFIGDRSRFGWGVQPISHWAPITSSRNLATPSSIQELEI